MSQPTPPSASFTIAGETVVFPNLASGTAVKNGARRFETAWNLPHEAAFAMAASVVEPAAARALIDPKDPYGHLQFIQTPDGKYLLCHRAQVWTPLISGDGGNGRSRYSIQTSANGHRRPWPIGRHHQPAVIDYHPASLDDMTTAVSASAAEIKSTDLMTQIARNPRGVWNPPVVVLARAFVTLPDGSVKAYWFLHSIEGSTRVEACHELTDVPADAPLKRSDSPLEHLRETHAKLVERFNTTPASQRSLAAARAATMPALIVVGVVEADGQTPISAGFPAVVNDYVESVHVQPRPFSELAQSNVIGERFVLQLQQHGRLSIADAEALLGRTAAPAGKPTVRAAKLVHAVCDPKNDELIRDFVITADGAKLTKVKRAKLIGPLVVRQFEQSAGTAERALMRAFTPDLVVGSDWAVSGVGSESLRKQCLADVAADKHDTSGLAELMARGGPALCASGLLLGDQESTVKGFQVLRGQVDKVVEQLGRTAGGVNVLADAVGWADGERVDRPRRFDVDGTPQIDANGDQLHFSPSWWDGNMGVRALAFTNGVIPEKSKPKKDEEPQPLSPEERYDEKQTALLSLLMEAQGLLKDLFSLKDEQQRSLIKLRGLRKSSMYTQFPAQLERLYAKYGQDDDPFSTFDEDDLPDDQPLDDDEDDDVDDNVDDDDGTG